MPVTINGSSGLTANDGSVFTNASGNVGIGTSSPTSKLTVSDSSGRKLDVSPNSSGIDVISTSQPLRLITSDASNMIFQTNNVERGRFDTSGNFLFNSGYGSVATAYGCRAWVNFNGTGTVAIRASGNVSSITDLGAGYYRANFTTALSDANFATTVGASNNTTVDSSWPVPKILAQTTGAVDISTPTFSNSGIDCVYVAISCFR